MDRPVSSSSPRDPLHPDATDQLAAAARAGLISRRSLLRRGALLGLSAAVLGPLLSACGDDDSGVSGGSTATTGGSGSATTGAASGSTAATGAATTGGRVRVGIQAPPGAVDPLTNISKSGQFVTWSALPGLVRFTPQGDLVNILTESWTPDAAGTEWTVVLQDTPWQDGRPLSANDVVWTLDHLLSPDNPYGGSAFRTILSFGNTHAADDHTVVFTLDRPYADFEYLFAGGPIILPEGYVEGDYANNLVGVGPFLLEEYSVDRGASYRKNPDFWDADNVFLDGYDIVFYGDDQAISLAVQGGELNIVPIISYAATIPLAGNSSFEILTGQSSQYQQLHLRVDTPPFDDKRVRQAFALGIDREAIIDTLFGGNADIGNDHGLAPVFQQSAAAIAAVPQRTRDVEQARDLLSDAGYPDGLQATLTTEQYLEIPQYAQLVQSQLRDIGIELELEVLSQEAYYGTDDAAPWLTVPLGITDWGERATPGLTLSAGFSSGAPFNESRFANPEFDAALAAFETESDPAARDEQAITIAQIQNDETPAVIAYWIQQQRIRANNVQGLLAGPATYLWLGGVSID